jgi:uncharacterized protein YjiS (DUF1127 family)
MHASDDFYFLRFEHRPLTPEQWEQLRQGVRHRVQADRAHALRDLLAWVPKLAMVAARGGWAMGRTVVRSAGKWSRTYTAWRARRRAIKELRGLDDRVLKDIGLHRSEIESVIYGQDSGPVAGGKVAASPCPKPHASRRIAAKGAMSQLMQKNAA